MHTVSPDLQMETLAIKPFATGMRQRAAIQMSVLSEKVFTKGQFGIACHEETRSFANMEIVWELYSCILQNVPSSLLEIIHI